MKKYILLSLLVAAFFLDGQTQQPLKNIARKGWFTLAYRISADTAELYLQTTVHSIDHYLDRPVYGKFSDTQHAMNLLPVGHYLLFSILDSQIVVSYHQQTRVQSFVINNQFRPQLLLRNDSGHVLSTADLWYNRQKAIYHPPAQTYQLRGKHRGEGFIKIVIPGDTSFATLTISKEETSIRKQRWQRFLYGKIGRGLTWIPRKTKQLFQVKKTTRYRNRIQTRAMGNGYVLFNKPLYKPLDTVKFKAYVLDKKKRRYNKKLEVSLEFNRNGKMISSPITVLQPVSKGAYIYAFATSDSLPNDTRYWLRFRTKKKELLLNGQFSMEDYLLNEVSNFDVRSRQKSYYAGDTLHFTAYANDANGLPVMDGKVKLYLINERVNRFYDEQMYVPDTLWQGEKILAVEGNTVFAIPTTDFPNASLSLEARFIFQNSNHERKDKNMPIAFYTSEQSIEVVEENGVITAQLYRNGQSVSGDGFWEHDLLETPQPVQFPFSVKYDPHVSEYSFFTRLANGKQDLTKDYEITSHYKPGFSRWQSGDTAGFVLSNSSKIKIYYTVFDHDRQVYTGASDDESIAWKSKIPVGRLYTLKWQYYWAGRENYGSESIGLLSKIANTVIGGSTTVYPGQQETIDLQVKDYRNRPVQGANLTVLSYNTQFSTKASVPEPPYMEHFKGKKPLAYSWYETDEPVSHRRFLLGKNQAWRSVFGLDTMQYYQFLFPKNGIHMVKTPIQNILPELSVLMVEKGVPQEIYLLYINRRLVYYNGVTEHAAYSFSNFPGYAQVGIRLRDRYVELDSIYLQPYYKHDVALDVDQLPANAKVKVIHDHWSPQEVDLLNKTILQLDGSERNNNAFFGQGDRLFFTWGSRLHQIGPFQSYDSIQFFSPGKYDFNFLFEPGYQYNVSPRVARLEKKPLLVYDKTPLSPARRSWMIGDTISPFPAIQYAKPTMPLFDVQNTLNFFKNNERKLLVQWPSDTTIAFTMLFQDSTNEYRVFWGGQHTIEHLTKGTYRLVLMTKNHRYVESGKIIIDQPGTYCVRFNFTKTSSFNTSADWLKEVQAKKRAVLIEDKATATSSPGNPYQSMQMPMPYGTGILSGIVRDKIGGAAIANASIYIKGYNVHVLGGTDGRFSIAGLPGGSYILLITCVGYEPYQQPITIHESAPHSIEALLEVRQDLQEVVVTAYGTRQKRSITSSIAVVRAEELTNILQGRVAGLNVSAGFGNTTSVTIRGVSGVNGNAAPLIVVDGVVLESMPNMDSNMVVSIDHIAAPSSVALYGLAAANGVIIISTKNASGNGLRKNFVDYATWQPNLVTDKNGSASFVITYPDNITSWETYVVGMDKRKRITRTSKIVKAFKPVVAQLQGPQFLIAGDSAIFFGKKINYTSSNVPIQSEFSVNNQSPVVSMDTLQANNSLISKLPVLALLQDSLSAQLTIRSGTGFMDGERRTIPVFRKGTMETHGRFFILGKDSLVTFTPELREGIVTIHAQNNTLDMLLDELKYLRDYPYYCMEQTSSKLKGLAMEKKIRAVLNQPFVYEKEMQSLRTKLLKAQSFEGSWGWWEGGRFNLPVTNYVVRSLLYFKQAPLEKAAIRNALLFMQQQLLRLDRHALLETLYTLSEAEHEMDYAFYLASVPFDSVSIHQQWQIVAIRQQQKISYKEQLQQVMDKRITTMFGGIHWGENSYSWNNNVIATTVLALNVLQKEHGFSQEVDGIIQYFLEMKRNGHWRNTVEAASILEAILPAKLQQQPGSLQPASLQITGDTTCTVQDFPFTMQMKTPVSPINIQKKGGGTVYLTAFQKMFNPSPLSVDSVFKITRSFQYNDTAGTSLRAGDRVVMKVVIDALRDAEFVELEFPIPAGCTYVQKTNNNGYEHREYFKDRIMIFRDALAKGQYTYEVELEVRYPGKYIVNPAKASLMYFPTFFGRNETTIVDVTN